jgi:hypothetical protein
VGWTLLKSLHRPAPSIPPATWLLDIRINNLTKTEITWMPSISKSDKAVDHVGMSLKALMTDAQTSVEMFYPFLGTILRQESTWRPEETAKLPKKEDLSSSNNCTISSRKSLYKDHPQQTEHHPWPWTDRFPSRLNDWLLLYVPLKNFSLIWRRHHYR